VGGDEDNRNGLSPPNQLLLKVRAGHPGHRDVEKQALSFTDDVRRKERFRGWECLNRETALSQQVRQRLPHGLVVIDDRHQ
jgi:hypothetical protein